MSPPDDEEYDGPPDEPTPQENSMPAPELNEEEEVEMPEEVVRDLRARDPAPLRVLPREHERIERAPPQDLDAEASVLGSMLMDNTCIHAVLQVLEEGDFYREGHRRIFRACVALHEGAGAVDLLLLREELRRRKDLEAVGGPETLMGLLDKAPTAANALHYARLVAEYSRRRAFIAAGDRLTRAALEGVDHAAVAMEVREALSVAHQSSSTRMQSAPDFLNEVIEEPPEAIGEGLLAAGSLMVIQGEEGLGKSLLALALALDLARGFGEFLLDQYAIRRPVRVGVWSAEGGRKLLQDRLRTLVEGGGLLPDLLFLSCPAPAAIDLNTPTGLSALEATIVEQRLDFMVPDPLANLAASWTEGAEDSKPFTTNLQAVSARTRCGLILVHHTAKATAVSRRGSSRRGRGHSSLNGAADTVITLEQGIDEGKVEVYFSKVRRGPKPKHLVTHINPESLRFVVDHDTTSTSQAVTVGLDRIIGALSGKPEGLTYAELAAALGEKNDRGIRAAFTTIRKANPTEGLLKLGIQEGRPRARGGSVFTLRGTAE